MCVTSAGWGCLFCKIKRPYSVSDGSTSCSDLAAVAAVITGGALLWLPTCCVGAAMRPTAVVPLFTSWPANSMHLHVYLH